jgi:hypothetical protein
VRTRSGHVYGFGSTPPPSVAAGIARAPSAPREICRAPDAVCIAAGDDASACAMSDGRIICVGASWSRWLGWQLAVAGEAEDAPLAEHVRRPDVVGSYCTRIVDPGDGASVNISMWELHVHVQGTDGAQL